MERKLPTWRLRLEEDEAVRVMDGLRLKEEEPEDEEVGWTLEATRTGAFLENE